MPDTRARASRKVRVEQTTHDEAKRRNIPTNELQGLVGKAETSPPKVLYPRDPSLDPQLVWKGKDQQDAAPLEVPAVPVYIQEKIHPKALIEDLRAHRDADPDVQMDLFADFNGISFDDLVEFYEHEQSWTNRMILGDSLLVMTSLAEKEGLRGQVQCIYMDPPYGIRFGSNWQVSTLRRDVKDGRVEDTTRQPEQVKAFRDTWQMGVHSYLAYLRDRLAAARELLSGSGSIFVQMGDEHVHLARSVLDEIFGAANYCSLIAVQKTAGANSPVARVNVLASTTDFILWYAKDRDTVKYRQLYAAKGLGDQGAGVYTRLEFPDGSRRNMTAEERAGSVPLPQAARVFRLDNLTSTGYSDELSQPFAYQGRTVRLTPNLHWKTTPSGMRQLVAAGRVVPSGTSLAYVRFHDDFPVSPLINVWSDVGSGSFTDPKVYVVQTNTKVVERCILMTTDPGDLVLDPTCGSGTTAFVAEQWGRRWITIDTSRVALTLARQRVVAARHPYYPLADPNGHDVRQGFRYKTVPHVTLKSIANNPDIREGMTRQDIDAAITRHAEREVLYDQPEIDGGVVRVTGPFTVESLSPHVTLPAGAEDAAPPVDDDPQRFHRTILDHLRNSGVQNTVRHERLLFDSLEPWPGTYVHATGEYRENDVTKRAAISVGPEYGTVDATWVREAVKEVAGVFDLVIVCGFAFDAYLDQELRKLGSVTVLKAAMNPDLAMGDELLKKTGSGNLFMVFGEPDLEVREEDGKVVVEIRGVDVYDPTTGEIRSHSTDDIACWFIDTDYNRESFFVRHAYFTGAGDPYAQLKRALRADIDEAAWASLYSTVSRPFPKPSTGRIAVKVINHYGDEVMSVYEVGTPD